MRAIDVKANLLNTRCCIAGAAEIESDTTNRRTEVEGKRPRATTWSGRVADHKWLSHPRTIGHPIACISRLGNGDIDSCNYSSAGYIRHLIGTLADDNRGRKCGEAQANKKGVPVFHFSLFGTAAIIRINNEQLYLLP